MGGPTTAENAWIADFIRFCAKSQLPADFISTHHYPTDTLWQPGDVNEAQLSKSRRSVLREQAQEVRRQAGDRPVYYTEWCTSSNPRDPMQDEPHATAFVIKTIMEANGLVQGYSNWTFSDIFEDNYFPSVPFHGGFGLLDIHGIAKPVYRAFELLHALGMDLIPVEGGHSTVHAWTIKDAESVTVLLTNYALPHHPIATESIHMTLIAAQSPTQVTVRRIDSDHANAKRRWQKMGSPKYPNAENIEELNTASRCQSEPQPFGFEGGTIDFGVALPPLSRAAVTVQFGSNERG